MYKLIWVKMDVWEWICSKLPRKCMYYCAERIFLDYDRYIRSKTTVTIVRSSEVTLHDVFKMYGQEDNLTKPKEEK